MIERFEDLIAWQKARELNRAIYVITSTGPFARDYALRDQLRKSSISVMSNIAEGFDRRTRAEFRQFLSIAKGSASEVRCQMYAAEDVEHVSEEQATEIREKCLEISRIIGGLMATLDRRDQKD